jgi:hypothetical protein
MALNIRLAEDFLACVIACVQGLCPTPEAAKSALSLLNPPAVVTQVVAASADAKPWVIEADPHPVATLAVEYRQGLIRDASFARPYRWPVPELSMK